MSRNETEKYLERKGYTVVRGTKANIDRIDFEKTVKIEPYANVRKPIENTILVHKIKGNVLGILGLGKEFSPYEFHLYRETKMYQNNRLIGGYGRTPTCHGNIYMFYSGTRIDKHFSMIK